MPTCLGGWLEFPTCLGGWLEYPPVWVVGWDVPELCVQDSRIFEGLPEGPAAKSASSCHQEVFRSADDIKQEKDIKIIWNISLN